MIHDIKAFEGLIQPIIQTISAASIDEALEQKLNERFPANGPLFTKTEKACYAAIKAGWMCAQGDEGRRFGRIFKPSVETGDLSVDVVQLNNIAGPHHRHPKGEVCMVMPLDQQTTFDNHGAGWCVYAPDTAHFPTVRGGSALILYLLPGGHIEFTGKLS